MSLGQAGISGLISVAPTIFADGGELDLAGTQNVISSLVDSGASGLTVLGVMGEASELTEAERELVMAAAIEAAGGLPVVVGVTGSSTDVVRQRATNCAESGASAVMVSPTTTVPLNEAVASAAAGELPIVVQDYPPASGVVVSLSELVNESNPQVVAVKVESPPTSSKIAELQRRRPGLRTLGGLGGLFLIDELRAGASGVMTGFPLPDRLVAILDAFGSDPVRARNMWTDLLPLMRLEAFAPYSLAVRKEVWRHRGYIRSARCRWEGADLDSTARNDVLLALSQVGFDGDPA